MENQASRPNAALEFLGVFLGEWNIEISSFQEDPSAVFHGHALFQWLEGGAFLLERSQVPGTDFPSVTAVIGPDDAAGSYCMLYSDSRGVSRIYQMSLSESTWKLWRDFPGFSQRFIATFNDDRRILTGYWENSTDGSNWERDFNIKYAKVNKS